jgi:hypothetical protein
MRVAQMQAAHARGPLRSGGKVVQRATEAPVRCALMSDLLTRLWSRWPSWVCAYVSGTNLYGVLEGTETNPVLPELSLTTAFPITLLSVSRRGSSQACA